MVTCNKSKILVAESDSQTLQSIETALVSFGYQVSQAKEAEELLVKASQSLPDLILLDILLSKKDGFQVIKQLKSGESTKVTPIIIMSTGDQLDDRLAALEAGVDDVLGKPPDITELRVRVRSLLKIKAYNEHLHNYKKEMDEAAKRADFLKQSFEKIKSASLDTIFRLSRAAEYKDEDTGEHIQRMSHYSTAIARKMGMSEEFLENILFAAPMHDIGKIGIPDAILKKPGKLDEADWQIMRTHTTMGAKILSGSSAEFMKLAEEIAISHHEKWDGKGYPQGIKSTDIPAGGRIVALADVFDALTSERPYKKPMPLEKAFSIITEGRGTHFDPDMVDIFVSIKDEIEASLNWWKFLSSDSTSADGEQPLF